MFFVFPIFLAKGCKGNFSILCRRYLRKDSAILVCFVVHGEVGKKKKGDSDGLCFTAPASRRPATNDRVTTAIRSWPNMDWGQELLRKIHRLSGKTRREVAQLAQDRRMFHQFIERLCSLADQSWTPIFLTSTRVALHHPFQSYIFRNTPTFWPDERTNDHEE